MVQDVQLIDGNVADVVQVLLGTIDAEIVLRGAGWEWGKIYLINIYKYKIRKIIIETYSR